MLDNNEDEWIPNMAETEPSPLTSMATDARAARGTVFKGCRCPSHQEAYNDWPTQNAELTIAQCMTTCMYCGNDFRSASDLCRHLNRKKYSERNISIYQETPRKRNPPTPTWTSRPQLRPLNRSDSEPLTRPSNARITRSRSLTNSANRVPRPW
jgi:hypothetical protein